MSIFKFNSIIIQAGRSLIYLKMYHQENKHILKSKNKEITYDNKIFNESDMNLSYIAWKGTTINRKTML